MTAPNSSKHSLVSPCTLHVGLNPEQRRPPPHLAEELSRLLPPKTHVNTNLQFYMLIKSFIANKSLSCILMKPCFMIHALLPPKNFPDVSSKELSNFVKVCRKI